MTDRGGDSHQIEPGRAERPEAHRGAGRGAEESEADRGKQQHQPRRRIVLCDGVADAEESGGEGDQIPQCGEPPQAGCRASVDVLGLTCRPILPPAPGLVGILLLSPAAPLALAPTSDHGRKAAYPDDSEDQPEEPERGATGSLAPDEFRHGERHPTDSERDERNAEQGGTAEPHGRPGVQPGGPSSTGVSDRPPHSAQAPS
jgi:hypothetical protein